MSADVTTISAMPVEGGRLVLVTGPSGAGKDSILAAARLHLQTDGQFVFPRRVVTRAPNDGEDHATLSVEEFADACARGAFALHWNAHGFSYGLPRSIEGQCRAGKTVVCNVSRTTVAEARRRFRSVTNIEITAPRDVLRARLLTRGRETSVEIDARLSRQFIHGPVHQPDVVIQNDASIEIALITFLSAIGATRC